MTSEEYAKPLEDIVVCTEGASVMMTSLPVTISTGAARSVRVVEVGVATRASARLMQSNMMRDNMSAGRVS